jgi:hypothetical protein
MGIDLVRLAAQGRAYSASRPFTPEELDAVIAFQKERGLGRLAAADFVRNGILSLEDLDKALKKDFKPKTQDDAAAEAEKALKGNEFASKAKPKKPKKGATKKN